MFSFYWSHVTILISQGALRSWNSHIEPCWVDCWCLWGLFCKVCAILEGCNGFGKVSIHSGRVSIHSGRVIIQSGKVSIHSGSVKTKEIGYVWHLHLHAIVANISLCLSWFLIFCRSQYGDGSKPWYLLFTPSHSWVKMDVNNPLKIWYL